MKEKYERARGHKGIGRDSRKKVKRKQNKDIGKRKGEETQQRQKGCTFV